MFEVVEVNNPRIAKDMVEMPTGLKLISLQELIIKAMMRNKIFDYSLRENEKASGKLAFFMVIIFLIHRLYLQVTQV